MKEKRTWNNAPREAASARGRFGAAHLLVLLLLLVAPALALHRLTNAAGFTLAVGYGMLISGFTYWSYARDKRSAREQQGREPERVLHVLEFIGGWPGAFVAQHRLRHKCAKLSYQILFWLIVALYQFMIIDYLRGWAIGRGCFQQVLKWLG